MRNAVLNPSANVNLTGWVATMQASGTVTASRGTGAKAAGAPFDTYARFTVATVTTGAIPSTGWVLGTPAATHIGVTGGEPWVFSAYARSTRAGSVALTVTFHDAAGTQVGILGGANVALNAATFTRLALTTTPPATAVRAYVRVYATTGSTWAVGNTLDVGGAMSTPTLVDYFDGDNGGGRWEGTAGASYSVRTSLEVDPNPANGTVVLQITDAPAGDVAVARVDANGAATVRRREGQAPIAGAMTLTDTEASLTGPLRYDVVDSSGWLTSASTELGMVGAPPRVAAVQLPQDVAAPDAITGYEAARRSPTVVHWPEGRPDPVVILRPTRTREGTLTALVEDYAAAAALMSTMAPGRLLHLRQADHPGMDMYFAVLEAEPVPLELLAGGWRWSVRASYVEVKAPTVPLLGAPGWSYADLAAEFTSYAAVRSSFEDYADLIVGPVSA